MAFDIYLLSRLDYDDAEPLLEGYINDAIQAFVASKAGQAHVRQYPKGGYWIGTFIDMGYLYGGFTLPKMTKGNAQEVMEYILPRKITLMQPSDAENAIDELAAFWTFLDEAYGFRSAKAITKYLHSIATKFPQWMMAPNRGGMAKNFMMQGQAAGFDMTTQAGVEAFQAEYNQQLSPLPSMLPTGPVPMTQAPADMQAAFEQLGLQLPAEGEPVNLMELMGQFLGAMEQLDPDEVEQLRNILEEEEPLPHGNSLRSMVLGNRLSQALTLSSADEERLQAQTITAAAPGTVLQDLQTFIDFIGDAGLPVSSKLQHLSLKVLGALNEQLSTPIHIDLKRPQQKSYPNIHGLYLLLRATGLANVITQGKQSRLMLNPEIYAAWQRLNPTEQYFSLLEIWFIRSHPEMLGEERSGPLMMGDRCLGSWSQFTQKSALSFKKYSDQDQLVYWPGLYNLALMEMFGWLTLTSGKPSSGKGWRILKVAASAWGKALMGIILNAYQAAQNDWPGMENPELPLGDLQPALQPYFPEWKASLVVPNLPFRAGRHIFKVSLGKVWRRIAISGEATLDVLSDLILDSVDFDHDHLDRFAYKTFSGHTVEVFHPYFDGAVLSTDQVKIGSLPISIGSTIEYLFDFGDCWEFQVQLEALEDPTPAPEAKGFGKVKGKKKRKPRNRQALGEILERKGQAPEQYPDD